MKDLSECYEIARLIAAKLSETITPEELVQLDAWLAEDERHRTRFCRIQERLEKGENDDVFRKTDDILKDMEKVKRELPKKKWHFLGNSFFRYAAAVVLLMGGGTILIINHLNQKENKIQLVRQQETVPSGSCKAILTLGNGEQVRLEDMMLDSIREGGALISNREGELAYKYTSEDEQKEITGFNTITIPRSGEYKLTLSDGTRVWLNSATELKYPVKFAGDSRRVFLKGEAYFEVAADAKHPFIVESSGVNVKVLGTGFNVMAYPDDTEAAVTLVHGKVGVQTDKQQVILLPDEQYVYQLATHQGTVRKVDVGLYIGWKEGILNFDGMPLDDLTQRLSRWYNVDFFFTSEQLKKLKFSGAFKKYNELRYVLNIIEEITDVQFVVKSRSVIVNSK